MKSQVTARLKVMLDIPGTTEIKPETTIKEANKAAMLDFMNQFKKMQDAIGGTDIRILETPQIEMVSMFTAEPEEKPE